MEPGWKGEKKSGPVWYHDKYDEIVELLSMEAMKEDFSERLSPTLD
jgi:hypothetical protein